MIIDSQKQTLGNACRLLDYLQQECEFNNYVKNEAMRYYWSLLRSNKTTGFTRKRLIAALTYYVCNREGHGTSMQEVGDLIGENRHRLFKTLKTARKKLRLPLVLPSIEGLIIKHGNRLKMKPETITKAIKIANQVKGKLMNNPLVITGTCLYLAGQQYNEEKSAQTISRELNISESTIYSLKKRFINNLKFKIN